MTSIAIAAILLASPPIPPAPVGDDPFKVEVFGPGAGPGMGDYASFRIPGIVATPRGTLIAYCEARKTGKTDWDAIDILLRRSVDGGATWGPPRRVADIPGPKPRNPRALAIKAAEGDITYNNPVAIAGRDGSVHLIFCLEYMRCFYSKSVDDGETFSPPVELNSAFDAFRPEYPWKVLATGPGHGIELRSGRLLVPIWLSRQSEGRGGDHRPSCVATIASDDGGRTWGRGAIVVGHPTLVNPSETVAVERADGSVGLNIRHEGPAHRRAVATSPDGVSGWSAPAMVDDLREPVCMASLVRLDPGGRLLFANPDNRRLHPSARYAREDLTVRLSLDGGRTWPVARTLEFGPSGYSDLAVTPGGTVHCLYEVGPFARCTIRLARFRPGWISAGGDFATAGP